jgi:hypothetical protein
MSTENNLEMTGVVLKNNAGEYIYAIYIVTTSSPYAYTYRPEFTRTLVNTNGLLDQARNMTLSRTTTPFLYFSVDSKLYVYREGEGCVEVNTDVPVTFGEITCVRSLPVYSSRVAELVVAANNPSGEGGTVYTFKIDPLESKNLALQKKIEDAPAGVKDITYLY